MSLPQLSAASQAHDEQDRLERAASVAVEAAHAFGADPGDPRGARRALESITHALADLPLPGHGQSEARLAGLAAVASVDVTLGRLVEAHCDALAILAELRAPAPLPGQRWGVWAAEGPESTLAARPSATGFVLDGIKPWCSGATFCTHALVTATNGSQDGAGRALYAVALEPPAVTPLPGSWRAIGLSGTSTEHVRFSDAPAGPVGGPGEYLTRPGFWHGAIGVAAVWWGGAAGIAAPLYSAGQRGSLDAHGLAHLGAVEVSLAGSAALLREAAALMDTRPEAAGERIALTVRAAVEATASDVVARVGRALGPAPLCRDRDHARRVADLEVYVRQSHAERDLATLGELSSRR
ncbi:MAG: acyl-CoA dehydrogenase [Mycobacterium sp.]|nr:acyl-CoA dehydrogenase [Mycobacterium sp.]